MEIYDKTSESTLEELSSAANLLGLGTKVDSNKRGKAITEAPEEKILLLLEQLLQVSLLTLETYVPKDFDSVVVRKFLGALLAILDVSKSSALRVYI